MTYAIRAKMSKNIRVMIGQIADVDWQPILTNSGKATGQSTYRTVHCIRDYEKSFCLVIQRQAKTGQLEIDLEDAANETGASDEYQNQHYIYRCIATNMDAKTDLEIIDWYNQRAECSENKIKELKYDFGADDLPCSDYQANSFYFSICILAYNLFVLMRALTPSILKWSSLCAQKNKGLWQKFGVSPLAGCSAVVTGSCLDIPKNVKTATPQQLLKAQTDPTIMLRRGT